MGGKGTALQAASIIGHLGIITLLLAYHADVNAHGGRFGSPIRAAFAMGHEKAVELLLARGADVLHERAQGGFR